MDLKESGFASFRHPWEFSRLKIVESILRDESAGSVLDVGCGDCFVLNRLSAQGWKGEGVDKNAVSSDHHILRDLADASDNTYDVLLLMDVLEHVPDDKAFLQSALTKLKGNGLCLITVPAWQFLFSDHDRFLEHYRRYDLPQLNKVFPDRGFRVERVQYFYFSLFLIRCLQYFLGMKTSTVTSWKNPEDHFLTRFMVLALHLDFKFCQSLSLAGIRLPGLSCLALLRKNS